MSNTLVSLPLSSLTRSKLNIRKTEKTAYIEQLAASIESQGLLENLVVTANGGEIYEVIAGGRRLAALKLLAKKKKLPDDHQVSCLLLASNLTSDIVEVSLAENTQRAPVHPADQFEAFAKLQKEGLPVEDIAARFGMTATVVRQRLRLAAVSTKLMAAYRRDEVTLEQMMAFAITDDQALQEQVWDELRDRHPSPQTIRQYLTRSLVEGSDRRAIYIGTKAYEKAGGTIVKDLFDEDDEGYFTDIALLDRLVTEKLEKEGEQIRKEGWGWIEIRSGNEYVDLAQFGRIRMVQQKLSEEDEAKLTALSERYDALVAQLEDEENAALSKELDDVTAELEALQDKKETWPEDQKPKAGAIISLDYTGCPQIVRGLVRPEDRKTVARANGGGSEAEAATDIGNGSVKGYAEYLLVDLAAQRTVALQESLAQRPDVAFVALLHVLVLEVFYDGYVDECISITPERVSLPPSIGDSKAKVALEKRHAKWHERLPEREALWDWLTALNRKDKMDLLAACVAVTLDVTHNRSTSPDRSDSANRIATAVGLDMAKWWKATKENFFDRLTKQQIIEAVSEACSTDAARSLDALKKSEMAAKAEELVAKTGWLPALLRMPENGVEARIDEAAE